MARARVDSRWWYWIAAAPVLVAFWLVSALWTGLAIVLFSPTDGLTLSSLLVLPLVAVGLPGLVVVALLPYALVRDAAAVRDAGAWDPPTVPYVVAVVACPLVAVGVAAVFGGRLGDGILYGTFVACALAWAGVALVYLDGRRRRVETNLDALRE